MWAGAVLGMAFFGISEEQGVAANQLHLIFMPLMTCYGLAYLLVQWNRLGIDIRLARIGFIILLFLLCAFPMINTVGSMLFGARKADAPVAALRPALHRGFEQLDEAARNHRIRHAVGDRLVRRSPQLVGA